MVKPKCFVANYTFWTAYQHHFNQNINYRLRLAKISLLVTWYLRVASEFKTDGPTVRPSHERTSGCSSEMSWLPQRLLTSCVIYHSHLLAELLIWSCQKAERKSGFPGFGGSWRGRCFGDVRKRFQETTLDNSDLRLLCLSYPQRYRCVEIFRYTGRRTTAAVSHTQGMIPFLRFSLPECFV